MNKEEVKQLAELQTKFEKRCKEVCSILKDFDGEYEDLCYFIMAEDEVFGKGYNDDYEEVSLEFNASFLTADDDVIRDYVKDEIRKREEEKQRIKESLEAKEREREMALLKKLKIGFTIIFLTLHTTATMGTIPRWKQVSTLLWK